MEASEGSWVGKFNWALGGLDLVRCKSLLRREDAELGIALVKTQNFLSSTSLALAGGRFGKSGLRESDARAKEKKLRAILSSVEREMRKRGLRKSETELHEMETRERDGKLGILLARQIGDARGFHNPFQNLSPAQLRIVEKMAGRYSAKSNWLAQIQRC